MRLALECEAIYASRYPFIEYGQDLEVMAELEKGYKIMKLTETAYDAAPPKEVKEKLDMYMER